MYRFALRPRWILSHLLVIAIVAACAVAGFWQLDRLDQKRDVIDRFEERSTMQPVAPAALLSPDSSEAEVDDVDLRAVELTGTYLVDDEVIVRNRTLNGSPGYWVLTPLVGDDGVGVVVNRGWVPLSVGQADGGLADAAPPAGRVTVRGTLAATQERGSLGSVDPDEGTLDELARADVGRIAAQIDVPVLPAYVTLSAQVPAPGPIPVPVEPIEPDEGPHQGYAVQWFIFASIAAGGYPLILRKVARDKALEEPDERPAGGGSRRSRLVPVED
ncbi:MAG: SURF1 family protein [Acidimicrobiia bacterium]|nr:SURF1 family protein [Acidimicrobiia bacterium]